MPGGRRSAADDAIVVLAAQGIPNVQIADHARVSLATVERRRVQLRDRIDAERQRLMDGLRDQFLSVGQAALVRQAQLLRDPSTPPSVLASVTATATRNAAIIVSAAVASAPAAVVWDDGATRAEFIDRHNAIAALMADRGDTGDAEEATVLDLPARSIREA